MRCFHCWSVLDHIAIKARNDDLSLGHCKFLVHLSQSRTCQISFGALNLQSVAARGPLAGDAQPDFKKSKTAQVTSVSGEILGRGCAIFKVCFKKSAPSASSKVVSRQGV